MGDGFRFRRFYEAKPPKPKPVPIAHRGALLEAPENTLAAFDRALELGAQVLELDVRPSAEGELVVIHDATVDRTTDGSGAVHSLPLDQLRRLDAGAWWGAAFANQRIPTLRELLERTRGRAWLAVELKGGERTYPGMARAAVDLLRACQRLQDVIIVARECETVELVRSLAPGVRTSCFHHGTPRRLREHLAAAGARPWHSDVLFSPWQQVRPADVELVHRQGLRVVAGLEREQSISVGQVQALARAGVDGIIANDLALLVSALRSMVP